MTGEPPPQLPHAIYFDTNALRDAGHALNKPWMSELREEAKQRNIHLWIPEIVLEEWVRHLRAECASNQSQIRSHSEFLREVTGKDTVSMQPLKEMEIDESLRAFYVSKLKSAGFGMNPSAQVPQEELVKDALDRVPPFEKEGKKGDSGFKDALILESISAHAATSYQNPDVMVVSNDERVRASERRFVKRGVRVTFCKPEDAPSALKERLGELVKHYLQHGDAELMRFLKTQWTFIRSEIMKRNVRFPRVFPDTHELRYAVIHSVDQVRPISVGRAFAGRKPVLREVPPGRCPIEFEVEAEFDLTISSLYGPDSFLEVLTGIEIPASQPTNLDSHLTLFRERPRHAYTERRSINVDGTVVRNGAGPIEYSDLRIDSVM